MTKETQIIFIISALIAIAQMTSSASIDPSNSLAPNNGLFAGDLLKHLAQSKVSENVVFSPLSIQMALAMPYLGAAGKTAEELEHGLRLPSADKDQVGQHFSQLVNKNSGEAVLNIANRIFVNSDYSLKPDFNKKSETYFKSGTKALNFKTKAAEAAQFINSWVEQKTNNKITNLIKPDALDSDTVAVIVNAIYFKGKWAEPFSTDSTAKRAFWVSKEKSVEVDMMYGGDRDVKYAEYPELNNATAIELPYENSDISMIFIRPSEQDGLADLENKLSTMSIQKLSSKMRYESANVMIPKFKIDFSTGLVNVLKDMGIRSIFEKADLPGIFESSADVKVSDVQHKAFIDVNEAGSEAAAASFIELMLMSLKFNQKYFTLDRPFLFAIKDSSSVYFLGHVAKF